MKAADEEDFSSNSGSPVYNVDAQSVAIDTTQGQITADLLLAGDQDSDMATNLHLTLTFY